MLHKKSNCNQEINCKVAKGKNRSLTERMKQEKISRGAHCAPLRKKLNLKFNGCQKERPPDKLGR